MKLLDPFKVLFNILLLLALQGQSALASTVSTNNFLSGSISNDDETSIFEMTQFQQGVPMIRRHHRHVDRRDLHYELFEPKRDISLDFLLGGHIQTITLSHNNASYVNVDSLLAHELFHGSDGPLCVKSNATGDISLNLRFRDHDSYQLAKQNWEGNEGLIFAIDDESCMPGNSTGSRVVFGGNAINFIHKDGLPPVARIGVSHHEISVLNPALATTLEVSQESFHRFTRRSENAFELGKRSVRRDVENTEGFGDDFEDFISDFSKDELFEKIADLTKIDADGSINVHVKKNLKRKPRVQPLGGLQELGWLPTFTFIDSYIHVDVDFFFGFKAQVINPDDFELLGEDNSGKFDNFISNHIRDAHLGVEAMRSIQVGLQAEMVVPANLEMMCSWMLFPVVLPFGCGPMWTIGTQMFNLEPDQYNHYKHQRVSAEKGKGLKAWESMGMKMLMSNGFGIWVRVGAGGTMNFTTPGFDLNIPQGSVTEVGYKDGHTYHRNWDAEIKWRAPHLNITQAKVYANVAVGPRIKIDIGMPGIKKASLGFQIRAEIPKLEVEFGQNHNVDEHCDPGPMKDALGFKINLGLGVYAGVTLPGLRAVIDTNLLLAKKLGKDWKGLIWTKKLWGICWEDGPSGNGPKGLESKLNQWFGRLTSKVNGVSEETHTNDSPRLDGYPRSPDNSQQPGYPGQSTTITTTTFVTEFFGSSPTPSSTTTVTEFVFGPSTTGDPWNTPSSTTTVTKLVLVPSTTGV